MYVKKLDEFYGVTVYALYPNQFMLEGSRGLGRQSYVSSLAKWLVMGILSSQSLFKILTLSRLLLLPEIKYGSGLKGPTSSLSARTLDDLALCRARAFYTIHKEVFSPREVLDMEESKKLGKDFVSSLKHEFSTQSNLNKALNTIMLFREEERYQLLYEGLSGYITCKPDATLILMLRNGLLRVLVVEVAETDVIAVLSSKHIIPRLVLYMSAIYLHYGIPPAGLYVSLSPASEPPALLFLPRGRVSKRLISMLEEVKNLIKLERPPLPGKKITCSHCVYLHKCQYRE